MRFGEVAPSTTASVFSRVAKTAGSSRAEGAFASAAGAANTAHAIARRRRCIAPYRTSEWLDVMARGSRSARRRRRAFAAFAAEVRHRQHQRRGLERGAEVERRADAPVAFGQVRHHGEDRRAYG